MSTALRFLDTNVLLYSISRNPAEHSKRRIAEALLDFDDNALSVQVLQEFYVQATRSTRADALPHDIAAGLVRAWLRFKVQDITHAIMLSALDIKPRTDCLTGMLRSWPPPTRWVAASFCPRI
jgi:predicted nucleic acid-binding protein